MPRAIWNGVVVAESQHTEVVEGNHNFPPQSIRAEYFRPSRTHTMCGWKGTASYNDLAVGDEVNPDAAWYYPDPATIKGYVTFWKGVKVEP